jgi:hypothetical protein
MAELVIDNNLPPSLPGRRLHGEVVAREGRHSRPPLIDVFWRRADVKEVELKRLGLESQRAADVILGDAPPVIGAMQLIVTRVVHELNRHIDDIHVAEVELAAGRLRKEFASHVLTRTDGVDAGLVERGRGVRPDHHVEPGLIARRGGHAPPGVNRRRSAWAESEQQDQSGAQSHPTNHGYTLKQASNSDPAQPGRKNKGPACASTRGACRGQGPAVTYFLRRMRLTSAPTATMPAEVGSGTPAKIENESIAIAAASLLPLWMRKRLRARPAS